MKHEDGKGRTVVVTGAGNGIGRAIAARMAADGWTVVGVDRDRVALADVLRSIDGEGVAGDVRDLDVLAEARRVAESRGRLAAWVNNAGIVRLAPIHLMEPDVIDETLDINLRAVVFGAREALRSFLAQSVAGSIVNISSVHASGGFPGYGPDRRDQGRYRGFHPLRLCRIRAPRDPLQRCCTRGGEHPDHGVGSTRPAGTAIVFLRRDGSCTHEARQRTRRNS